jgi:hypothetical protein
LALMSTVQLQIPDDLRSCAETRAAEEGFASLDQYIASLIRADQSASLTRGAPAELTAGSPQRLHELILDGLSSGPGREITDADWQRKQQALVARHGASQT